MTHTEFLENLIQEYKQDFEKEPATNDETKAFRDGMIFAWKLAIIKLKKGVDK